MYAAPIEEDIKFFIAKFEFNGEEEVVPVFFKNVTDAKAYIEKKYVGHSNLDIIVPKIKSIE